MRARLLRLGAAGILVCAAVTGVSDPAAAASGPGTWTKITTPSGPTVYQFREGGAHHLTVSGTTSGDVTSVNIDCVLTTVTGLDPQPFAVGVPVTAGSFSVVASLTVFPDNCRMRAVPADVDPNTGDLASYTGPIFYANGMGVESDGGTPYGYNAIGERGDGFAALGDAAKCAATGIVAIPPPDMVEHGSDRLVCAFSLPPGNVSPTGPATASAITVDGHNAYLPGAVHRYLNDPVGLNLGLVQSRLTISFTRTAAGDLTITESAPLMRCSNGDAYPPTNVSCPSLAATGVTFRRVARVLPGAHQISFRDSFASTNGLAHAVGAQYQAGPEPPPTGAIGYAFPHHGSAFHPSALDQVVHGLGTKAGTVLLRTNMYALEGEPTVSTLGLTWSRAPAKVQFAHAPADRFAMPYSLAVPAGGKAYIGFVLSQALYTASVKPLAAAAQRAMINAPTISSPHPGATIKGHATTVKGTVTLSANGLPTTVLVNGHGAQLTRVSASKATYKVTFAESFGTHTIKVVAKDAAGNVKSKSITVKNVAP